MKAFKKICIALLLIATAQVSWASRSQNYYQPLNLKNESSCSEPDMACVIKKFLFDGIYIGASVGYDTYKFQQDSSTAVSVFDPALNARGFMGSILTGYGRYFDWFYIGGEIYLNLSGANETYQASSSSGVYDQSIEVRQGYGFGIIPGIRVSDTTLIFARVGYARTYMQVKETANVPGTINARASNNAWQNGVVYGLGIETAVFDSISLRLEYAFANYNSIDTPFNTYFKVSDNQFMLTGIYHFIC